MEKYITDERTGVKHELVGSYYLIAGDKEAVFMEKYITGERTGLKYELVGDYYLIAGEDEPDEEQKPIGIWGQRHLCYLKNHRKLLYINLLTSSK